MSGLNELKATVQQQYGPGYYVPNVFIQYWSMRVMAYLGSAGRRCSALWGVLAGAEKFDDLAAFPVGAPRWAILTPFLMATAGWLLTESGRQPWIVQGLMTTADGVSASVSAPPSSSSASSSFLLSTPPSGSSPSS